MNTVKVTVTPEMAVEWLKKNSQNRNASHQKVTAYANDMASGNWHFHHQGIAFYDDGVLADGQHRLMAIVATGMSFEFLVTFGIKRDSAIGIDTHRARKTDDVLRITNHSTWIDKDIAAIIKLLMIIGGDASRVSASSVAAFGEAHKDALLFSKSILQSGKVRFITVAPVKTAIVCAYYHCNHDDLARFYSVLVSGVMDCAEDVSAIRLRERLLHDGRGLHSNAAGRLRMLRLTMRAIKAFAQKEKIKKLVEGESFIYPIIGAKK